MRSFKIGSFFLVLALSSFNLLGQSLDVTVTKKNSCAGTSNGSITISVDNTTTTVGPYSYLIFGLNNSNGPFVGSLSIGVPKTISNLPVDNYLVSVSDGDGTVANFSTFENVSDVTPGISFSVPPVATNNTNCSTPDGTITISPTGGSGSFTYSWTGPGVFSAATQNLVGLSGGSYIVTIGDNNANCSFTSSAILVNDPLPSAFTIATPDNTLCSGDGLTINLNSPAPEVGVTYTVEVDGALTATTFLSSSVIYSGLSNGAHTIRVQAKLGSCTPIFNTAPNLSVTVYNPVTLTDVKTDVTCNGGTNGSIVVTASGGSGAGYTYSKDNGTTFQGSNTFSTLAAATYQVVVKDGNGCLSTATGVTINQPTVVTFTDVKTDVTGCFGNTNGSIVVTASGGSGAGYTYSKNNGATFQASNTFAGLGAATYQIEVKDGAGCVSAAIGVVIGQPTAVTFTDVKTDATCNGVSDGTITVTASGGSGAGYTYSKNNGATFQASNSFTGLSAATYQIKVKDGAGCISAATGVVIGQPTAVTFTHVKTDATCNGVSDGTITVTASGGSGAGYSYSDDNGATFVGSNIFSGLAANTYQVKVKDGAGCVSAAIGVVIGQPTAVTFTDVKTDATCNGVSDGTITVTASGGSGAGYTYSKNNGATFQASNSFTGLSAATYQIKVKDGAGCISAATGVVIGQPTALTAPTSKTDVSCNGGNDGTATVTPTGGTGPYTVLWSTGATTTTISTLIAGTYTVVVTDANSCTANGSATVGQPTALTAPTSKTDVSCNGGNNGTATVTPTGGTGPYTVLWSTGATTTTISTLIAGTYTVVVTDANSCTANGSATVGQPATALTAPTSKTDVSCNGGNDGTATVTPTGGTGPYTVLWSTGATTTTISTLIAGTYTVVVTDANSCTANGSATVGQPTALTAPTSKTDVSCNGGNNGTATVTPTGGTGPYTVLWSTGATTTTISTLIAGTYTVVVTDANSCTANGSATVGQPTALTAPTSKTDVSCNGGNDGTATVTPTGGTGPYTVLWSTGATTTTISTLIAGTYTVVVTDANSCTANGSATAGQPATALTAPTSKTDVSCNGGNNGTATVTPTGGTGPYTVLWSTGATTTTISTLIAGTYTVVVTDANSCTANGSATVGQPATALTAPTSKTDVSCNGGNNGTATVTPTGGTGPYTVLWSTGATTTTISTLIAGTYTVVVTDANSCTANGSATVGQPTALTAPTSKTDVSCNGGNNGTATVTPTGGTGPYTVLWSTGATTTTISTLIAGTYTVVVTDANSCTANGSATVGQPAVALTAPTSETDANCNGGNDGTATVTPTGGTGPYTVLWSTGATTTTISTLIAGTYTVVVTDANSCTANGSATVGQPTALTAPTSKTDVSCNGGNDGTATVTPTGGTGPYTVLWSTGATTTTISTLIAGTYTVVVTDANSCTANGSATVGQPTALTAPTSKTDVSCNGGNNGTATVTPTGGTGPYTVLWSTGATTTTISTLIAGTYTVVVTDANSCTANGSATVGQPATALTAPTSKTDVSCNGGNDGTATVTPTGGTGPYTVLWSTGATTTTISTLIAGTYTVVVTDANSCTANGSATVGQPAALTAPTGGDVTVCFDGAAHTGSATPGAGESIVWYTAASGGSLTTAPTGTTAGTYAAFAAAKNTTTGCESSARTQVTVTINTLPTVTFTTGASAICAGSSSTYTTQAGQANYAWSVTGGAITAGGTTSDNTATIQWTSTGSVSVNYEDVNLCSAGTATSMAVTVDALPTVAAAGSDQTNVCGTVSLSGNTPSPGTGSWSFAPSGNVDGNGNIVNPSSPTSGFNGTPGKTYTLRWTITNGTCPPSSDDVAISFDPAGVTPSAAGPDQNQCNNGSFTLAGNIPTSGTGTWSIVGSANGATITSSSSNNSTVTGLTLGTSVTLRWSISNGASCTSIDDVVLSNNDNPTAATAGSDQAVCGTSTTLAGNTPTIGTGAWSITSGTGGSITNTADPASVFTGIQGNSYTLRWTVSNGACSPSFDDVDITFDKTPTTAVAGPDILNACGTISLSANNPTVGVGQWTISSNPDNLGNVATPSSNLSNFNGTAGINYVLTWTITNGSCPNSTDDVQIQYSSTGPTAADAGTDQNICGTTTTLSGNTPAVGTGQWSFDTGGNPDGLGVVTDVNNQSSGFSGTIGQTYKLVWTITNGTCNSIDQVSIQFNAPPSNSDAGPDQGICGTSTTLAANVPSIGTGVWSFSSNPDGLGAIANLNNPLSGFSGTAGQIYVLTWTISSGSCTPSTNDVQITFKDITLTVFNTNYCQNAGVLDLTTIVSATPAGGTLTFTGTQVSGSNFDPTGLSGVQSISVKYDQSGCSITKPLLINVLLPTNPACSGSGGGGGCSVPVISKQDICSGSDGNITITSVSGGQAPYQFSKDNGLNWSTATSTFPFSFNSLTAGTYSVLVKDNIGCTSTVNTIVVAYNISGLVSETDVTTCTGTDGKINISNIQGGSGSYKYSIDGGVTFPYSSLPITGLAAGTYSVVILDNVTNGCISAASSITISLPGGCVGTGTCATVVITPQSSPATCTNSDGQINFNINPAVPLVNNVGVQITIQGISSTNNTVAITNFNNPLFTNIPLGVYNYTIIYGDPSCTKTGQVTVDQSGTVGTPIASNPINATCFGSATGAVTLDVFGETGNLLQWSVDGVNWNNFTAGSQIVGIPAGVAPTFNRVISVRRNSSDPCNAAVTVQIGQPNDITTSFTSTDASCSNNDGTIQVGAVSGGTGPYTYRLDSVDYALLPANNTFTGLAGGPHKFTVIDAIGCNKYFKTTINFPGLVDFATLFNNPTCSGNGNDGNVIAIINSSGTFDVGITTDPINDPSVFQTVISSGSAQVIFNGLSQGDYYVVAKPIGALCPSRSSQIHIGGGPVAVDFNVVPEDFICFETKGTVRIAGVKGSSLVVYNYQIISAGNIVQSGIITQLQTLPGDTINYTGLDKGNYQMILSQDQSACPSQPITSTYKSFSIDGPAASLDTLYVNRKFSLPNIPTGSMLIGIQESQEQPYQLMLHLVTPHLQGQKNNYAFDSTWVSVTRNNQNLIMEFNAANIYGGDYRLSIRDTLGCTRTYDLSLDFDKEVFVPNVFTPNNDGKNDVFEILNLPVQSKLVITNRWGKEVYQSSNYQNNWNGGAEVDGIYYYSLTASGKVYTGWVEILHPSY